MNLLMAANTQRHQIVFIIGAASGDRLLVMHQLCHHILPMLLAHLTQRMLMNIAVTDFLPRIAVPLVLVIDTGKVFVVTFHHLAMVFTVTALVVCQLWAATIPTGSLWFSWHSGSPRFLALKNLLRDCSLWRSSSFYFMLPF